MTSQSEAKEEGVETGHANGGVPSNRPNTVGFFHPELREVRWQVLRRWALTGGFAISQSPWQHH
jgi:hypothetical protein